MECDVRRTKINYAVCHYRISSDSQWEVIAKRTHRAFCCRFEVYKNGLLQYVLVQPSIVKQIIADIPIISFFIENPFYFYRNNVCVGSWKPLNRTRFSRGRWEFYFEGSTFQVNLTGPRPTTHILYQNGENVARYQYSGYGNYHICYAEQLDGRPDLLILFAAFVEHYLNLDVVAMRQG